MAQSYATAAALYDRLGWVWPDERLTAAEQVIETASRWIEHQCGRRFYAVEDEVRYFTLQTPWHNGGTVIEIDDFLSISELATDNNGDGVHETIWTAGTDYYLGPRNAPAQDRPYKTIHRTTLTGRFYLPSWEESIRVTGEFGYSTETPSEIRELCLVVAEMLARNLLDTAIPGAESYKLGTELQIAMKSPDLTPMARRILALYRDREFVT